MTAHGTPIVAIADPNTLAALGLKQLLLGVMPKLMVDTFGSMAELQANHPEQYIHFFVAMNIVLENRDFFLQNRRKTIVLTPQPAPLTSHLSAFHCICINVPEKQLVRSLLAMLQTGHHGGDAPVVGRQQQKILTDREAEVMTLIVQGLINKEIADRLCIGLSTVVTHRKNIMEKLGVRSVSALTIYAVMNGYVDINKI